MTIPDHPELIEGVAPYYHDAEAGIAVYHGDCLLLMDRFPLSSACITDPPYCSGAYEAARNKKRPAATPESKTERPVIQFDSMGSLGFDWVFRNFLLILRGRVVEGGHLAMFTDWRMCPIVAQMVEASGWRWNNVVVWDKGYPGLGAGFRAQHEFIVAASNGPPEWASYEHGNVLQSTRLTQTNHPHQKPLNLITPLIKTLSPAGGMVLDPFCGGGSTLLAARACERRAIGVDLSEAYCEIAANRLRQGVFDFGKATVP